MSNDRLYLAVSGNPHRHRLSFFQCQQMPSRKFKLSERYTLGTTNACAQATSAAARLNNAMHTFPLFQQQ
jgi:hypothetical protein